MKVLVITSLPDPHVEMVATLLPPTSEVVIFDPLRFPIDEEISYSFIENALKIHIKQCEISDAVVVWFRKPQMLDPDEMPVSDHFKEFAFKAYKESIIWLYSLLKSAFWVSDYWNIKKSESKPYQLGLAATLGLSVPNTLITNSPIRAKSFVNRSASVVVKPLNSHFVRHEGKLLGSFTTRLPPKFEIDFEGLCCAPAIFQEQITGTDVRVTVVGDNVFAAKIKKSEIHAGETDWRLGNFDDSLEISEDTNFPTQLRISCVRMVNALGLRYGAFDFIYDDSTKQYWFIEINPNGQWGFVEIMSGLPIARSFVALFNNAARPMVQ